MAAGGRVPWTMEMLTPAFSRMVLCRDDSPEASLDGHANMHDWPLPPCVRTQESRLKGGAEGSSSSNAETILFWSDTMYCSTCWRIKRAGESDIVVTGVK